MNVEARGRKYVELGLLTAGIMPSIPEYDDGIDLIASLDQGGRFVARSIQIKAVSDYSLMTDRKYRARPEMLLVHVMNANDEPEICALTYDQQIEGLTNLTSCGATRPVDRLERGGLVVREKGTVSGDGRAVVVSLTGSGAIAADGIVAAALPYVDALIDDLVATRTNIETALSATASA